MNRQFRWRHISDVLLESQTRKIYVKGKTNKVFVATVAEFLANDRNLYDFFWLPLYEQKYLFSNLNQAFFDYEKAFRFNGQRNYNHNDKYCFNLQ